jgi:hypothetical protein
MEHRTGHKLLLNRDISLVCTIQSYIMKSDGPRLTIEGKEIFKQCRAMPFRSLMPCNIPRTLCLLKVAHMLKNLLYS